MSLRGAGQIVWDREFDVLLVGEKGVGKSLLASCFAEEDYVILESVTWGPLEASRICEINNKRIRVNLWDLPGLTVRDVPQSFFRKGEGIIFLYDITDRNSFLKLNDWIEVALNIADPNTVCFLVGTKLDLEHFRQVSFEEVINLSRRYNMPVFETSSISLERVEETFSYVVSTLDTVRPLPVQESSAITIAHPLPRQYPNCVVNYSHWV